MAEEAELRRPHIEEAFGPFAGFIASILFWFGYTALADAAITVAMVEVMTTQGHISL